MPNILVVIADQLAAQALPAYGNRVARTPHIDLLASRGVVFNNAYTPSPLCGPSRSAMMTGLLPSSTGAFDNACEWRADIPTWGHYLRRAGYRTILAGKMHFVGPDQLHGFEERVTTDIYPADFGWTPDWNHPADRPEWYHSMESVLSAGPCARSNQIDFDEEVMFAARRRLFDLARTDDKRPFCLVVSLTHPHDPFNIEQEYWDRYEEAEIDLPRIPAPADPDPHSRRLRQMYGLDEQPVTEAHIRAARHAYYGAISYVDDQLGALRETLATAGLAHNTSILFLSDHGEMLGERGLWYKMSFLEGASRVPLIIHAPDRVTARRVLSPVSLLDLLPTLCDLAGAEAPTGIDGRSLSPHLHGADGHESVFGEYCGEGALAPIVMIRRAQWKFIHSPGDPDQLFDLSADPDELHNLAALPEPPAALADFRADASTRWNLTALRTEVLASQQRRRLVAEALRCGRPTAWDYQPPGTAATDYIRSHKPLETLETDARLPSRTACPD